MSSGYLRDIPLEMCSKQLCELKLKGERPMLEVYIFESCQHVGCILNITELMNSPREGIMEERHMHSTDPLEMSLF